MELAPPKSGRRLLGMAMLGLVVLVGSCWLDRPVATWVHDAGVEAAVRRHGVLHEVMTIVKLPGVYWTTVAVAAAISLWHPTKWRGGALMLLSGLPGLINSLIKWGVGRTRPYKLTDVVAQPAPFVLQPFRGGWIGLFQQSDLAFPSGHACIAFATATALAILLPKWRWAFYAVALMVAAERVIENAHYVSDTVGAAMLSVIGVQLIWLAATRRQTMGLKTAALAEKPPGRMGQAK